MNYRAINLDLYVIQTVDNTNKYITLSKAYPAGTIAVISNGTDKDMFVTVSKTVPSPTFPSSSTTPVKGQVVLPGTTQDFELNPDDKYISGMHAGTGGTGNAYASIGDGQ